MPFGGGGNGPCVTVRLVLDIDSQRAKGLLRDMRLQHGGSWTVVYRDGGSAHCLCSFH